MDPRDIVGRTLETGREVTQRSQERLESLVGQLQRLSEEQLDQVATLVSELRDRSLLSGEQVAGFVDRRVRAQLAALGIATRADLDRVEAKVDRLGKREAKRDGGKASSKAGNGGAGKGKPKDKAKGAGKDVAKDGAKRKPKGDAGAKAGTGLTRPAAGG